MRKLADLPNLDGFEFWGVREDRTLVLCRVVRDPQTGVHSVGLFSQLVGWYPLK